MKAARIAQLIIPHLMVGLLTVGTVTLIPSALYYAFAIYSGLTQGDFGGPLNFVLIPLIFFVLGLAVALLITVPISILIHSSVKNLETPTTPIEKGGP